MYDTKTRETSSSIIKLMIEYRQKINYGLSHNRDVFFSRHIQGAGGLSLGYDNFRNLKLFISSIGATRYEKGSVVALSKDEYSVFVEKSERILTKMKVCTIYLLCL
jgi:hypothetical protein